MEFGLASRNVAGMAAQSKRNTPPKPSLGSLTVGEQGGGTARAVARNTIWGTAGRVLGGLFALGSLALISRSLGPQVYGDYATVLAFFFIAGAVADGGLYQILVRDLGRPGSDEKRLVSTAVTLRTTIVSVALFVGFIVFLSIPKYADLAALAPIAALAFLPLSLGQLLMAVFQRHLAVRTAALIELVARASQLIGVGLLWVIKTPSPFPFLVVLLVATTIQIGLLIWRSRALTPYILRATKKEAFRMMREALPVGISLVFTLAYFRLDTILLSLLHTSESVGIYNLAYKMLEQLIFFPAMFIGVMMPLLTTAYETSKERFHSLVTQAARGLAIAALPAVTGVWFLRVPIALLLGGKDFVQAEKPLGILIFAVILIFAGTLLGGLIVIVGRQRKAVPVYALAMVISIGLNVLLIPRFSYVGTAWVTVVTEVIVTSGLFLILLRDKITIRIPGLMRIFFATGVMALPLILFANTATTALGAVAVVPFLLACPVIYALALFAFNVVTREDLRLLRKQKE